jgi:hypothetical protein
MLQVRSFCLVALTLSVSACLFEPAPKDGALACSTTGQPCPDGYTCAADAHCWRHPSTDGVDGAVADAPDMALPMSCTQDSDCATPTSPCQHAACANGSCGSRPAPPGDLPASAQKAGDCSKLACDGNGNVEMLVDTSDVPNDGRECVTDSCSGSTPTFTPKPPGSTCSTGVCNGKGACGTCTPGSTRCDATNKIPQQCNADGNWIDGTTCDHVCLAGQCSGICTPGDTSQCNGTQPLRCDANGQWVANGGACAGGCVAGKCTPCQPGARACINASTPESCSAVGQWVAGAACAANQTCIAATGQCGGECGPGQRRCNGSQPQVCNANGMFINNGGPCVVCDGNVGQCHGFSVGGDDEGVDAGGGGGGNPFGLDSCNWGAGEVAIGFQARTGDWMDGIALVCGSLHPDGSVTNAETLAWHGGTNGGITAVQCPAGMVLVGLDGSAGNYVNTLRGRCWWPGKIYGGDTAFTSTVIAGNNAGPNPIAAQCPQRYAMTGISGHSGSFLDHLAFSCHPIQ